MKKYQSFMNGVTKATYIFLVILMTAMTCMVFAQIVARYIVGTTPAFVNELATYCLIWIAFFGSSIAIRWNKHVAVDFLLLRLSDQKIQRATYIIQSLGLLFLVILFLATLQFAISQWNQYSATMGLRITWPVLGTTVATFLMILQMIDSMIDPSPVKKIEEGVI